MSSKIEWTDETWNPITGCTKISAGCYNCYAERMARRLKGRYGYPKDDPFCPGTIHQDKFDIKFSKGKKIFVCSMGDLFHEAVPFNAIREFVRCSIEKIRLSAEGNITDDDWKAFEATLQSRWEKIRKRVIRMSQENRNEEDVGFEIFFETTEDHREKLAGSDTEQVYLTSGTYHRLANMIRVGWHPRFEELMRELKEMS